MARNKKRQGKAVVCKVLLLLLYITIFSFSAQDGETSGDISMAVSKKGIWLFDFLTGGRLAAERLAELVTAFEHPLRKMAHFAEYALMGVLVFRILYCHLEKGMKRYWLAVLWVFVSAAADEIHQYFVPDRWASISDVLLDTCGGAAGAFLCMAVLYLSDKQKQKQNHRSHTL